MSSSEIKTLDVISDIKYDKGVVRPREGPGEGKTRESQIV